MQSVPRISLACGPADDVRTFNLKLPFLQRRIGVLVSGGLDSALLYYCLRLIENKNYTVTPYTITRNDGSNTHAQQVIDCVNNILNKKTQTTTIVPISEQNSELQVSAGMRVLFNTNHNIFYIGLIETLSEHAIGVPKPWTPVDSLRVNFPFKNLNKSHIVDLIYKFDITELLNITHSCVYPTGRCNVCNRCNERHWAFTKLGLVDPGAS